MRAANDLILDAVSVSSTTAYVSEAIPSDQMFQASAQIVTSGSNPNGAFKAQMSDDNPTQGDPQNWSDITSATVSTTNNGVYAIQKFDVCAQYIRFVYTNASGSGVVSARFKGNAY
jgi:hypothetical protein